MGLFQERECWNALSALSRGTYIFSNRFFNFLVFHASFQSWFYFFLNFDLLLHRILHSGTALNLRPLNTFAGWLKIQLARQFVFNGVLVSLVQIRSIEALVLH